MTVDNPPAGDRLEAVIQQIAKEVTPTEEEKQQTSLVLDRVKAATDEVIKPHKLSHMVAGSFVRDTWMPDKKEFDVFILFPKNHPREKLESQGLDVSPEASVYSAEARGLISYSNPSIRSSRTLSANPSVVLQGSRILSVPFRVVETGAPVVSTWSVD